MKKLLLIIPPPPFFWCLPVAHPIPLMQSTKHVVTVKLKNSVNARTMMN